MPRNREEADLFFCSVTPLQNVRNENVVDVVGGDHGAFTLGTGAVFDAAEDSPLASSQFVQDT